MKNAAMVTELCRILERSENEPTLEELAEVAGLSPFHVQRVFQSVMGLSPKRYAAAVRAERMRNELSGALGASPITSSIYQAGYNSTSRFYEKSTSLLGMTPTAYRKGGDGRVLQFATEKCSLGCVLVAATGSGVSAVFLGEKREALLHELKRRFPRATLEPGNKAFARIVAKVVRQIENPNVSLEIPLDIRGTAFQERVWLALTKIPAGETRTYTDIAIALGAAKAVRAVAGACGANPVAVLVPCHRVVAKDGALSGYRWGTERKRALLAEERHAHEGRPRKKA